MIPFSCCFVATLNSFFARTFPRNGECYKCVSVVSIVLNRIISCMAPRVRLKHV